jgi:hypothetical protein
MKSGLLSNLSSFFFSLTKSFFYLNIDPYFVQYFLIDGLLLLIVLILNVEVVNADLRLLLFFNDGPIDCIDSILLLSLLKV